MSKAIYLSLSADFSQSDNNARAFSGIAHSGKPFALAGRATIVNLNGLSYKNTIPTLIEHDPLRRAGTAQMSVDSEGLKVSGRLLSNAHGQEIAQDADEGFPWELSVHIIPHRLRELKAGEQAQINGQNHQGPLQIFEQSEIREVSFTPVGVDGNTHASILSQSQNQEEDTMTLEEALSKIGELEQKIATLEAKKATVEEALSKIGELEQKIAELETEKATLEEAQTIAELDAELSANGYHKDKDGKIQGLSAHTYRALLSANAETRVALLADLSPRPQAIPAQLTQEVKLSAKENENSALLSNAEARAKTQKTYI